MHNSTQTNTWSAEVTYNNQQPAVKGQTTNIADRMHPGFCCCCKINRFATCPNQHANF